MSDFVNLAVLRDLLMQNAPNTSNETGQMDEKSFKNKGVTDVTSCHNSLLHDNALKNKECYNVTNVTEKKTTPCVDFSSSFYLDFYHQRLAQIDLNNPRYSWKTTPPEQARQYHAFNQTLVRWLEDNGLTHKGMEAERKGICFLLKVGLPMIPEAAGCKCND